MAREPYPSDLTDAQWKRIEPYIPPERWGGRTRSVDIREVVNAVRYLVRTGCQWRAIPREFPPWQTVRHYYDRRPRRRHLAGDPRPPARAMPLAGRPVLGAVSRRDRQPVGPGGQRGDRGHDARAKR